MSEEERKPDVQREFRPMIVPVPALTFTFARPQSHPAKEA
jgi:hypothetical protein